MTYIDIKNIFETLPEFKGKVKDEHIPKIRALLYHNNITNISELENLLSDGEMLGELRILNYKILKRTRGALDPFQISSYGAWIRNVKYTTNILDRQKMLTEVFMESPEYKKKVHAR